MCQTCQNCPVLDGMDDPELTVYVLEVLLTMATRHDYERLGRIERTAHSLLDDTDQSEGSARKTATRIAEGLE